MVKTQIIQALQNILQDMGVETRLIESLQLDIPSDLDHGDYTTNVALQLSKTLKKSPLQIAQEIHKKLSVVSDQISGVKKVEVAPPGFINFWIADKELISNMQQVIKEDGKVSGSDSLKDKKILIEYAHPNTHKEMHIGHMRTLITGESLSRILESQKADVFRANYQGDIGLHVAKAMYGIQRLMHKEAEETNKPFEEIWKEKRTLDNTEKAHFLGLGYVEGSVLYEKGEVKNEIDETNTFLYQKLEGLEKNSPYNEETQKQIWNLYQETRQWSLDYYDEFYKRFYTTFNHLFFESQMVQDSLRIVTNAIGSVFSKNDGAVIFSGEQYGLHTRVFITKAGHPTYEAKDIANGYAQYRTFPFDKRIHVVGSEQSGYFQVVFKALELLDPEKFKDKQYHLPMGMVQFADRKMSSRTGDILRVDWLIDQVKDAVRTLFKEGTLTSVNKEKLLEEIAIGAIKYSVLKVSCTQNVAFDIKTSVSLQGNSGPYIQYTYARTQSISRKSQITNHKSQNNSSRHSGEQSESRISDSKRSWTSQDDDSNDSLLYNKAHYEIEEYILIRDIYHFQEIVQKAAETYSPNVICEYLFGLSQLFNLFYQKYRILDAEKEEEKIFRLLLTQAVGYIIKEGLRLLGIAAPTEM